MELTDDDISAELNKGSKTVDPEPDLAARQGSRSDDFSCGSPGTCGAPVIAAGIRHPLGQPRGDEHAVILDRLSARVFNPGQRPRHTLQRHFAPLLYTFNLIIQSSDDSLANPTRRIFISRVPDTFNSALRPSLISTRPYCLFRIAVCCPVKS